MTVKIALAGNPNCGKTTMFNYLTGSAQYVGNWPGVTVEKKEGRLRGHKDVTIIDLPGIYSLSPYTLEEVVARNYLIKERPDVILNLVDASNLERNLYLTTQLLETGIPVVVALNMIDIVNKRGDKIDTARLAKELGCPVVETSGLKGTGVMEAAEKAIAEGQKKGPVQAVRFASFMEKAIASAEEALGASAPEGQQRWFAIKCLEGDERVKEMITLAPAQAERIAALAKAVEDEQEDDMESIVTAQRYEFIGNIIGPCLKKKASGATVSDKIDRVVTNRWLALPIFVAVMFIVYYVSVTSVGTWVTDWTNDCLFGDGWHLFTIGSAEYEEVAGEYDLAQAKVEAFVEAAGEAGVDTAALEETLEAEEPDQAVIDAFAASAASVAAEAEIRDDEGAVEELIPVDAAAFSEAVAVAEPDPADYGVWVPGIPVLVEQGLTAVNCAPWLQDLILNGIIAGVGAVLGFVPQMLVLFLFLAFLEGCGYMARIAFIMDRIFRKFGLSGKSFIPMLIGTGCGVPGIMASRTIENERDRRMTIMTTTFVPCGAKLPIIALIAGALFNGAWWVSPSAYFVGIGAIIVSGIMLKKTRMFAGDPAPFVMELPAYHWPTVGNVLRSMWERGWSFIKKAGTVILLATIFVWFASGYGFEDGRFGAVAMENSILAAIGNAIAWLFRPLGWGSWQAAVAAITGLIAKENVVGTFGILFGGFDEVAENGWQIWTNMQAHFTGLSAYSFLVFNLLCAPCFAAIGAIKREMNNAKWTWFAIGYQCVFAYVIAMCIYQLGMLFTTGAFGIGTIVSIALIGVMIWMLARSGSGSRRLSPSSGLERGI